MPSEKSVEPDRANSSQIEAIEPFRMQNILTCHCQSTNFESVHVRWLTWLYILTELCTQVNPILSWLLESLDVDSQYKSPNMWFFTTTYFPLRLSSQTSFPPQPCVHPLARSHPPHASSLPFCLCNPWCPRGCLNVKVKASNNLNTTCSRIGYVTRSSWVYALYMTVGATHYRCICRWEWVCENEGTEAEYAAFGAALAAWVSSESLLLSLILLMHNL